ncbi:hypothetical protein AVEN_153770-1 [Araneus ventricosus]|uniref:Uncharacterized protein n=1 Tax=Araneus ventricosus TaxID=182803 RepID=A0A4Y2JUZ0_ARAVE|nr:hypothetical protein AVEN_153770-1 [Araneus ventricosus]
MRNSRNACAKKRLFENLAVCQKPILARDFLFCVRLQRLHVNTLRAYLQVQLWSGFSKSPLDWGWKETKNGLFSVITYKEPAPPALLSMISCKWEEGCNFTCTCRKSVIKCSTICYYCKGQRRTNSPEDTNIIKNSVNEEAEIDIRME